MPVGLLSRSILGLVRTVAVSLRCRFTFSEKFPGPPPVIDLRFTSETILLISV